MVKTSTIRNNCTAVFDFIQCTLDIDKNGVTQRRRNIFHYGILVNDESIGRVASVGSIDRSCYSKYRSDSYWDEFSRCTWNCGRYVSDRLNLLALLCQPTRLHSRKARRCCNGTHLVQSLNTLRLCVLVSLDKLIQTNMGPFFNLFIRRKGSSRVHVGHGLIGMH